MLDISDQQRLNKLLSDTIPLLCKRTLGYSSELSVEAFIGITLSGEDASNEVVMVSFKETLLADGRVSSYVWSELPPSDGEMSESFAEPVAFSISDSGSCGPRSPQTVVSIDGNGSAMERHGKYNPSWDDDRYCTENNDGAINGDVKAASSASTSAGFISFPLKMEQSDSIDDFEIDTDLEATSNTGNSYDVNLCSSVVCGYSSVQSARDTCPLLPVSQRSPPKSSKRSRKCADRRGSRQLLSSQHLPSSLCSKPADKMKKASLPAVNATVQSSLSEVVDSGQAESSMPYYPMFDGIHRPVLIAPTPMQIAPKKRCRVCYAAKRRREVRFCCGTCPERPGLCLEPCFMEFHKSMLTVTSPAFIFSGVEVIEPAKRLQRIDSSQAH